MSFTAAHFWSGWDDSFKIPLIVSINNPITEKKPELRCVALVDGGMTRGVRDQWLWITVGSARVTAAKIRANDSVSEQLSEEQSWHLIACCKISWLGLPGLNNLFYVSKTSLNCSLLQRLPELLLSSKLTLTIRKFGQICGFSDFGHNFCQ